MRERNITSSISVAGVMLLRLGLDLSFLAWNDRGGQAAQQNDFVTQNIAFQPSLVCHGVFGFA